MAEERVPPVYTLIAGINGAGKTSLYTILKDGADLGVRINTDEMITGGGGDWRDNLEQLRAGRRALTMINDCIDTGVSFHQETTLPGPTILKYVRKAKAVGFEMRLYYVGVDSLEIDVERVRRRVARGGHGVDERIISKRYKALPENLSALLPYCDLAVFYDNTSRFRQFAIIKHGQLIDFDRDVPGWFFGIHGIRFFVSPQLPESTAHVASQSLRFVPANAVPGDAIISPVVNQGAGMPEINSSEDDI